MANAALKKFKIDIESKFAIILIQYKPDRWSLVYKFSYEFLLSLNNYVLNLIFQNLNVKGTWMMKIDKNLVLFLFSSSIYRRNIGQIWLILK